MKDKGIKQDINFLEFPIHSVNYKGTVETKQKIELKTPKGTFKLVSSSDERLPTSKDKIILYYFMLQLAKNNFESLEITTTRYQISKDIWGNTSQNHYNRIEKALSRYTGLIAKFDLTFYKNREYDSINFHFIDTWKIQKDKKIFIRFNKEYIEQVRNSRYYRRIDFDQIKKLKNNLAFRLYDLLIKDNLPTFRINIIKLGKKLTLDEKYLYPSVILNQIKIALKELNKKTVLKIKLDYDEKKKTIRFIPLLLTQDLELVDDTVTNENLNTLSKPEYTKLKTRAINSLKEQNFMIGEGERSLDLIKEEMLKLMNEPDQE